MDNLPLYVAFVVYFNVADVSAVIYVVAISCNAVYCFMYYYVLYYFLLFVANKVIDWMKEYEWTIDLW